MSNISTSTVAVDAAFNENTIGHNQIQMRSPELLNSKIRQLQEQESAIQGILTSEPTNYTQRLPNNHEEILAFMRELKEDIKELKEMILETSQKTSEDSEVTSGATVSEEAPDASDLQDSSNLYQETKNSEDFLPQGHWEIEDFLFLVFLSFLVFLHISLV